MFKKITQLSILLIFVLALGLAACSGQTESSAVAAEEPAAVAEVEEPAAVAEVEEPVAIVEAGESAAVVEVEDATDSVASDDTTYVVDTAVSTIGWLGEKIIGDANNGTIEISQGALVVENGALVSGSIVIDMTSIASDSARLVTHLESEDFFSVDTYPTATLDILSTDSLGNDQYTVSGNLTIKGITNPIEFIVEAGEENGAITASADIVFDRTLYDITYKSGSIFSGLGDGAIKDEVQITVSLVALIV